jgi:hypothetical protein
MRRVTLILMLLVATVGLAAAKQQGRGRGPQPPPEITGAWSGTWSAYSPSKPSTPPKEMCAKLSANITKKGDDTWQAVFEGDCGRPYKYTITMEGRLVGSAVLFKGSVDLGAKDGGVYDWIGKATNDEFIGFYTSAAYTGVFSLAPVKQ